MRHQKRLFIKIDCVIMMILNFIKKIFFKFHILFAIIITSNSYAQLNKNKPVIGNWTMFNGQFKMNEKFGIHLEAQFRDYKLLNQPEQILFRTGLIYYLNSVSNLTFGYASIHNYSFDDALFERPLVSENRAWEQLLLK